MSLAIVGTRVEYDGGRIVVERTQYGWSIAYTGTNAATRYRPPRLTLRERFALWRWQRRMRRLPWPPERGT